MTLYAIHYAGSISLHGSARMQFQPDFTMELTEGTDYIYLSADGTRLLLMERISPSNALTAIDIPTRRNLGTIPNIMTSHPGITEIPQGFRCPIYAYPSMNWNEIIALCEFNWADHLTEIKRLAIPQGNYGIWTISPDGEYLQVMDKPEWVKGSLKALQRIVRTSDFVCVCDMIDGDQVVDWATSCYIPRVEGENRWRVLSFANTLMGHLPRMDPRSRLMTLGEGMLHEFVADSHGMQLHDLKKGLSKMVLSARHHRTPWPNVSEDRRIRFVLDRQPVVFTLDNIDRKRLEFLSSKKSSWHETGIWHPRQDLVLWNRRELHVGPHRQKLWSYEKHGEAIKWLNLDEPKFATFQWNQRRLTIWSLN